MRSIVLVLLFAIFLFSFDSFEERMQYEVFLDKSNLTPFEVMSLEFEAPKKHYRNKEGVIWVKVIVSMEGVDGDVVLEVFPPYLDSLQIFRVHEEGVLHIDEIGRGQIIDGSYLYPPYLSFLIENDGSDIKEYLLRLENSNEIFLNLDLYALGDYINNVIFRESFIYLYFGIMLAMAAHNSLAYFITKNISHILYSVFAVLMTFSVGCDFDILHRAFWPNSPEFNLISHHVFGIITTAFGPLFAAYYMNVKQYSLKHFYMLILLSLAGIPFLFLKLFYPDMISNTVITNYYIIPAIIYTFSIAVYLAFKKNVMAYVYVTAFTLFFIGLVITILQKNGILVDTPLYSYAYVVGSLVEAIILSVGLSYRVKLLEDERKVAYELLLLSQSRENEMQRELLEVSDSKLFKQNIELQNSIKYGSFLFKELNHRVKNNLQLIMSLLYLQKESLDGETAKKFDETISRVKAIALVHKKLALEDEKDGVSDVEVNEYLLTLVEDVLRTSTQEDVRLDSFLSSDKVYLSGDMSVQIGIVVNELVLNSIKYAFSDVDNRDKIVYFATKKEGDFLEVCIGDNGIGIQESANESSLGLILIKQFIKKMRAEMVTKSDPEGTKNIIRIHIGTM